MSTIRNLAVKREEAWLEKHGAHEYEEHDLLQDALEELADAYNYLYRAGDIYAAAQVANVGDSIAEMHNQEGDWHYER